jgi:hypothetical protein
MRYEEEGLVYWVGCVDSVLLTSKGIAGILGKISSWGFSSGNVEVPHT